MRDYTKLPSLLERVVHKYNQVESKKRNYGTDLLLTRAEIHTIAVVGNHPGINVTTLAQHQGITKGAASQMVYKLVDKALIEKKVSPDSDTEVALSLTERGQTAFNSHEEYHKIADEELFASLKKMPDETFDLVEKLLLDFEKSMEDRLR